MQIKNGAIGICVATLYEAEIMSGKNIENILITTPITNLNSEKRLSKLIKFSKNLMLIIDSSYGLKFLEKIAIKNKIKIKVLVDCDIMGIGTNKIRRTGAKTIKEIIKLASLINKNKYLNYLGITAYAGDIQHINNYNQRKIETTIRHNYLNKIINKLKDKNLSPEIISGGGTGNTAYLEQLALNSAVANNKSTRSRRDNADSSYNIAKKTKVQYGSPLQQGNDTTDWPVEDNNAQSNVVVNKEEDDQYEI